MKIADSGSIKDGELELIDALTGDLDWGKIEKILKEKHKLGLQDEVVYNSGDLVVHKEKIAYRLDFDVKVRLRVLFDRDGQCISLSTSSDIDEDDEIPADYLMEDKESALEAIEEIPEPIDTETVVSEPDLTLESEPEPEPEAEISEPEQETLDMDSDLNIDETLPDEPEKEPVLQTDFINTEEDNIEEAEFSDMMESENSDIVEIEPDPDPIDQESNEVMVDLINDLDDDFVSEDLIEDAASLINDIQLDAPEPDSDPPEQTQITEPETEDVPLDAKSDEELSKQMETLEEPDDDEGSDEFKENISQMASQIAEMISEINER